MDLLHNQIQNIVNEFAANILIFFSSKPIIHFSDPPHFQAFWKMSEGMLKQVLCKSGSSLDLRVKEEEESPGPLRRVFTTHARRRSRKKRQSGQHSGYALSTIMKEPLRVVHSVPLGYSNWLVSFSINCFISNYLISFYE